MQQHDIAHKYNHLNEYKQITRNYSTFTAKH